MSTAHSCTLLGTAFVSGVVSGPILKSDVELSFWGGVNPSTGEIIDRHHPLSGMSLTGQILAIPGGRGSCSGSGVLLELLLNGRGPSGIVFEKEDDILTLGVVVAEELFGISIPVVMLTPGDFRQLLGASSVSIDGRCIGVDVGVATASMEDEHPTHGRAEVALADEDMRILSGAHGKAAQTAMRIIRRMASLQGAANLIDVTQVHIDACIYTGPGSLAFAERMNGLGGRVRVPTTLNAISVDQQRWRRQGVDPALGEPASRLSEAYQEMGARPTFTCAPYLLDTRPVRGEQIAWAESNAVVFANSVLGARTMKYPDFLDLCIALTGRAPNAGPHIEHHRKATFHVIVDIKDNPDDAFYPTLGYKVGSMTGNRIPLIEGIAGLSPSVDDLKAFGAAFATVSSAPMFHILAVTPEAETHEGVLADGTIERAVITQSDLRDVFDELNSASGSEVDLVSLGNPHFSFSEIGRMAALCRERRKHPDVAVIVTTGREIYDHAADAGFINELEAFGVQFVTDTCWCMITEPVIPPTAGTIMTNSGKYAHYGPGLTGRSFFFGGLESCVDAACSGRPPREVPTWLTRERKLGSSL